MKEKQIKTLFIKEINNKDFSKKSGIDRRNVYKYRKEPNATIGTMLQVLYKVGAITVLKNESKI